MVIDLRKPVKGEYEGTGFGRVFIWTYKCQNGHYVRVRANAFRGSEPEPGVGGIECPQCKPEIVSS